jgi:CBS domain-containing protein
MATSVQEVMTPAAHVLDASASIQDAAQLMAEDRTSEIVVCDRGRVCGVVTLRDVTSRRTPRGRVPADATAGEICCWGAATVAPTDTVAHAMWLMRRTGLDALAVVDGGRPVGTITRSRLVVGGGAVAEGTSAA